MKKKQSAKTLRVAIIVDPYGGGDRSGEEEVQLHKQHLKRVFSKRSVTFETPSYMPEALVADLVIFDFGGMSLGNDLLGDNSRRLIRWMQDHPSSLVYVASTFTYTHGLKYELGELGVIDEDALARYDPWEEDSKPPAPNLIVGAMTDLLGYGRHREKEMAAWFNEPTPRSPR